MSIRSIGCFRPVVSHFAPVLPRVSHALLARHVPQVRRFATSVPTFKILPITDKNKDELIKLIQNIYDKEGCGICEKEGAEVFWFSPYSRCAHSACYEKIKKIEEALELNMGILFKNNEDRTMAHVGVIEIVKQEIGDVSILSFLERHGEAKLHSLFYSAKVVDFLYKKAFKP